MDLASVFDWFAQDSIRAAEQTDEPRQREMWMKLSELWGAAAQRCREEQSTLRPGTQAFMINLPGDHSYRAGGAGALIDRSVRAECPSVPSGSAKNV